MPISAIINMQHVRIPLCLRAGTGSCTRKHLSLRNGKMREPNQDRASVELKTLADMDMHTCACVHVHALSPCPRTARHNICPSIYTNTQLICTLLALLVKRGSSPVNGVGRFLGALHERRQQEEGIHYIGQKHNTGTKANKCTVISKQAKKRVVVPTE